MSAARTVSYSSPKVVSRSPDSTFQRTTRPDFAPWPPAASNNLPERENLRSHGWPSPKGRMPARSRFVVLKRRTCFCPATATSGAQGLAARLLIAVLRLVCTTGSIGKSTGMGGGPSGLPAEDTFIVKSTDGLAIATALEPVVSSSPPAIHFLNTSSSLSTSFGFLGGMVGSSACVMAFQSLLESGLAGATTLAEPPPLSSSL